MNIAGGSIAQLHVNDLTYSLHDAISPFSNHPKIGATIADDLEIAKCPHIASDLDFITDTRCFI